MLSERGLGMLFLFIDVSDLISDASTGGDLESNSSARRGSSFSIFSSLSCICKVVAQVTPTPLSQYSQHHHFPHPTNPSQMTCLAVLMCGKVLS